MSTDERADSSRFVICNEGYTIERMIHGMDAVYNDIQQWHYKDLVAVFGADPEKSKTFQVKTKQEAENLFNDKEFSSAPYLQVGPILPVQPLSVLMTLSLSNCICPRKMHPRL